MIHRDDLKLFAMAFGLTMAMATCDLAATLAFQSWAVKFDAKGSVPVELDFPETVRKATAKREISDNDRKALCQKGPECSKLAEALVYEARGESLPGAIAVGYVIVERTKNPTRWPKTIRGVVDQRKQFSYTSRRQKERPKPEDWERAYITSYQIMRGEVSNPIGPSDHYHTLQVKPKWAKKMQYVATVGSHKFYRDVE